MRDLSQKDSMMHSTCGRLLFPRQCHTGCLTAWIKLEHIRMHDALFDAAVFQADRIGLNAVNNGPPTLAQQPRPLFRTRIEWLMVTI
jgi:hypothetical protein